MQVVEVITGAIIYQLAAAEHHAKKGESVITEAAVLELVEWVTLSELRKGDDGQEYGVIQSLARVVDEIHWPSFPEGAFREENLRPWLLPKVYERLRQGQGEFLAELRPVIAMFVHFSGIDYEEDVEAGQKLDRFIRMVQGTLDQYEGTLLQVTIGEKGSFFYAAFGAPIAHEDEGVRAASAALAIRSQAPELGCISQVQIGISLGRLRAGAYGAKERRTYGVQSDDVNLAARLMQAASPGQILVSQAFHQTTEKGFILEEKPPVALKEQEQTGRLTATGGS